MDDALRIVVLGLEWFALWLERSPLQVAWPVLFVLVFQVFLFVVHVLQWVSRGMFLRVACDYPVTTTKGSSPCKNRAIGEWHRCHQHGRRWQRRTDHHVVDPKLPRWQTIEREVRTERRDRYGEGSLRARSRSIGLLYHRGYARRPAEVKRLVPELIRDYRSRWRELSEQFRQWRSGQRVDSESVVRQSGAAAEVAIIREATQLALAVAAIGLVCVGLALILRRSPSQTALRIVTEYYAALLFFLAVSVTRHGVWGERQNKMLVPHADWLRRSLKESARAYGTAILCAWLLGTIGRSMGDIAEAMPAVIVWGGLALVVFWALAEEAEKEEQRRRRRRRRSRPRPRYYPSYLTAVVHIEARHPGRCASCGRRIQVGTRIGRVPEVGWCCSGCAPSPLG
jgi:hypothetical protein